MLSSLDSLVGNLVGAGNFSHIDSDYIAHTSSGNVYLSKTSLQSRFSNLLANRTDAQLRLLLQKGVYPHEYMDSWDRLSETQLPPESEFYSSINDKGISDEDYNHAPAVWREFKISNMGEYHNLYLLTDTLLLSNVFNEFRSVCLKAYDLDPAHLYTAPGLTWQALLKSSRTELEPLRDPSMLIMFEAGIRGGIVQAIHRHAKANNT